MYTRNEKIVPVYIEEEVKNSYLNYAMSVIVGRALPDVRDGLKPVHRRILYAMKELGLEHNKAFKKAARIVGECFIRDTFVLTAKGLQAIQHIQQGDLVYTQRGLRKVTALFEMPPRQLIRIGFDNGITNTVTPSQKLKVLDSNFEFQWKEANKIKVGDYIVLRAHYPDINKKVKLHKIHSLNPYYLNENIAYLLGVFMSEGWIGKAKHRQETYRIAFACNSRDIIEKIADILMQEFDYLPNIEQCPYIFKNAKGESINNCRFQIRLNRRYITQFLIENFALANLKAPTKRIPQQIFLSPKSVIFAFISGLLDGDGSVHKNRSVIHYGSVSKELIDQLQILLQHLEIFSRQYVEDNLDKGHFVGKRLVKRRMKFYSLEFKGINAKILASKIKLYETEKESRRLRVLGHKFKKSAFEIIPYAGGNIFSELSQKHLGGGWYISASGEKFRAGIKYLTGSKIRYSRDLKNKPLRKSQIIEWGIEEKLKKIQSPLYDFINHLIKNDIYFMKVVSVNKAEPQVTYDIQVDGEHEFVANGMLSHNCLGKYHPHGDLAVYDALIRMAQDFSLRYPLVEGQGNVGSVDGDSPAAMRYVEAKLAPISDEMLADIDKNTVNFMPNFDASLVEPTVLPAVLPNLLVNGSSGIAVGMATNMPPHNLGEIIDGVIYCLDNPDCEVKDLMRYVKGPDFPTAGLICGREGIKEAYSTGKGKLILRARASIERQKLGKDTIVITEIPYQTNKSAIIESMAALVEEKKIEGIADIRDESDKEGLRIVIELRRDSEPQIILNQLFKHTQLEVTFGIINLALVDGRPAVLNLKQLITYYVLHRKEVIRRRTAFDLEKAKHRAHILEGLKIALKFLDRIIKTIKTSKNVAVAKLALMKNFDLTDIQAQAILEMQLQRLTALERDKIDAEYLDLIKKIELYQSILASEKKIESIIKDESAQLKKKYADERLTEIAAEAEEIEVEDLIAEEDVVVTISHSGYIKRLAVSGYRKQKRGGKGVTGAEVREEDFIEHLFIASTKDYLLIFTDKGRVHWLKVYEIPQASRIAKGKAVINLLQLTSDEKISSTIPVKGFSEDKFLVMATKEGLIKKTRLNEYSNPRKGGIIGITLEKADELIGVELTDGKQELILATSWGKAIRFPETQVRDMGRAAKGVRGVSLVKNDQVIAMEVVQKDDTVLTVTELGFAKRTPVSQYRLQRRGGKGIINIRVTKKNGQAVRLKSVLDRDELMVMTKDGMFLRCPVKDIRATGRSAQGVRLIKLAEKDRVSSVAHVLVEEESI